MLTNTITPIEYQDLIEHVAHEVAQGNLLDEIITRPNGRVSHYIGVVDLDGLADAVVLTLQVRYANTRPGTWAEYTTRLD